MGLLKYWRIKERQRHFAGQLLTWRLKFLWGINSNKHSNRYNEKADLWSLGTVVFQLIAGYTPFEGKNPIKVLQSIERGSYTYPEDICISETCRALIESLLQVNPEKRIGWKEYFESPFVHTEPEQYLVELKRVYGESYGVNNPLDGKVLDAMEKEESEQVVNKLDEVNIIEKAKEESKANIDNDIVENKEDIKCANSGISNMKINDAVAIIKSSICNTIDQARVFTQYLEDNEKEYAIRTYEKLEFCILINILLKLKTLISIAANKKLKKKKTPIIYIDSNDNEKLALLPIEILNTLKRNKELRQYLSALNYYYSKLVKVLRGKAFLLEEMMTFSGLNLGLDNIVYIIDQVETEEELKNWGIVKRRVNQCLIILNIIIEEYCLFQGITDKSYKKELSTSEEKGTKAEYQMNTKHLMCLKQLLLSKLKILETHIST